MTEILVPVKDQAVAASNIPADLEIRLLLVPVYMLTIDTEQLLVPEWGN